MCILSRKWNSKRWNQIFAAVTQGCDGHWRAEPKTFGSMLNSFPWFSPAEWKKLNILTNKTFLHNNIYLCSYVPNHNIYLYLNIAWKSKIWNMYHRISGDSYPYQILYLRMYVCMCGQDGVDKVRICMTWYHFDKMHVVVWTDLSFTLAVM